MKKPIILRPHMAIINKPAKSQSDDWHKSCGAADIPSPWLPAHRLDFETSGCLLVVDPKYHDAFISLFREHSSKTKKIYLADCGHEFIKRHEGKHDGFIVSRYRRSKSVKYLEADDPRMQRQWHSKQEVSHNLSIEPEAEEAIKNLGYSNDTVAIELISGARHQIRAFMASLELPIIGDPLYKSELDEDISKENNETKMRLHAWKLKVLDPVTQEEIEAVANDSH